MDRLIPIEDCFEDVLGKAARGHGLSSEQLAARIGQEELTVRRLLGGERNDQLMSLLARELNLDEASLFRLADGLSAPSVKLPGGVKLHNTPYPVPGYLEMTVNSYSIVPPNQGQCYIIDAGLKPETAFDIKSKQALELVGLFLTHTHSDHVVSYDRISPHVKACYTPASEPYASANSVRENDLYDLGGGWHLKALLTPGHSQGGTTYVLSGPEVPIAFVGDAIFCGSIGKVNSAYESALSTIREKILSLPDETILCPGHGPITTVAHECAHNPFFARRAQSDYQPSD